MAEVLVIDDEAAIAQLIKASLQTTYGVDLCFSGNSALELLRSGARFKVIVCDIHLSGLDGPALYEQIYAMDPAQAQRMLFVTGGIDSEALSERINKTRCLLIHKPYRLNELLQAIKSVVTKA